MFYAQMILSCVTQNHILHSRARALRAFGETLGDPKLFLYFSDSISNTGALAC